LHEITVNNYHYPSGLVGSTATYGCCAGIQREEFCFKPYQVYKCWEITPQWSSIPSKQALKKHLNSSLPFGQAILEVRIFLALDKS